MSEDNAKVIWEGTTKPTEFTYRNFNGEKVRRKVDVKQVLYDDATDTTYLRGFCHLRGEERTFKTRNITTMMQVGSSRYEIWDWFYECLDISPPWHKDDYSSDFYSDDDVIDGHSGRRESYNGMSINGRTGEVFIGSSTKPASKIEMSTYKVAEQPRKVSWLLALGILVMPYFFAWFTCRNGYSKVARAISFSWLIVFVIAQLNRDDEIPSTVGAVTQVTPKPQPDNPVYGGPLTDCELAGTLVMDMVPILDSLNQQVKKANSSVEYSYRDFAEWRVSYFNGALDKVQMKYPSRFAIDYPNSRMAYSDISVETGLYVQAYYQYLKSGRDPELKLPYQQHWDTIFQAGKQIDASCKSSWESAKK